MDICANSVFPVKYYQKHDEIGISVRKYHHQLKGEIQKILMGAATVEIPVALVPRHIWGRFNNYNEF
jgi:hypothetical protein